VVEEVVEEVGISWGIYIHRALHTEHIFPEKYSLRPPHKGLLVYQEITQPLLDNSQRTVKRQQ